MIKRALAATLCLMLVFALLPKTARAAGDGIQTELDIRKGSITIDQRSASVGGNSVGYDADGYRIIGGGETVANTVTVTDTGYSTNITLSGVNIVVDSAILGTAAFSINYLVKVQLTLEETNSLRGSEGAAGLYLPNGSELTISGSGSLEATGGAGGAGIGGGSGDNGGTVNITGGTVTATGGESAAGIGGGRLGSFDAVIIGNRNAFNLLVDGDPLSDVTVTAIGGNGNREQAGAGIGSGGSCTSGWGDMDGRDKSICYVAIYNGTVTATGGNGGPRSPESPPFTGGGAGIGSGAYEATPGKNPTYVTVDIHGGTVIATGGDCSVNQNGGGAGIGGGYKNPAGKVNINNANVKAVGKNGGKDIGPGGSTNAQSYSESPVTSGLSGSTTHANRTVLTLEGVTDLPPFMIIPYVFSYLIDVKPIDGNKLYLYLPKDFPFHGIMSIFSSPFLEFFSQNEIVVEANDNNIGTLQRVTVTIGAVTVSGVKGKEITPTNMTITLTGETFKTLAVGRDVSDWFTNLPAGLTVKISSVAQDNKSVTVTFSGAPTDVNRDLINVVIPVGIIHQGHTVPLVDQNVKWNITLFAVDSVEVTPATTSVKKGGTLAFSANVSGTNVPAQTVTWNVTGNKSAATTIDTTGRLSVGSDETATTLTVKATSTADTAKSGTATVTVTAATYGITVSPATLDFGKLAEDYTPPAAQTVTVTYTGSTGQVTLTQPTSAQYDIGALSRTVLDTTNKTATFTVQPKAGLRKGVYAAPITVATSRDSNTATVTPNFTVVSIHDLLISPGSSFLQGAAPETTVTVGEGITGFGLNNLGSVQMGPKGGDLTRLTQGQEYHAAQGSIIITLHRSYLNTLMPGAYTLRINLTNLPGQSYPPYVETTITVNAANATVPKTGDAATPVLWLGLMLLTGVGLVVRRKRQKG